MTELRQIHEREAADVCAKRKAAAKTSPSRVGRVRTAIGLGAGRLVGIFCPRSSSSRLCHHCACRHSHFPTGRDSCQVGIWRQRRGRFITCTCCSQHIPSFSHAHRGARGAMWQAASKQVPRGDAGGGNLQHANLPSLSSHPSPPLPFSTVPPRTSTCMNLSPSLLLNWPSRACQPAAFARRRDRAALCEMYTVSYFCTRTQRQC